MALERMFCLVGRCCIVTGGGTGIGATLAEGLVRAGASVVVTGRRKEVLENTVRGIAQRLREEVVDDNGVSRSSVEERIHAVACDVTDFESIPQLVAQAEELTGIAPTILVNNAGMNVRVPAEELTAEHWRSSLDLMVTAPFMLTRALSANMKRERYGRVVSIASLQSYLAFPHSLPYAAAKSGMLGLTRALAEEYSPSNGYENVTANAIAPGYVRTELTKQVFADVARSQRLADRTILGRNSTPEDLVGTCVFLSSPASAYITGQTIPVDGGFTSLGLR